MNAVEATRYAFPIRLERGPDRDPEVTHAFARAMRDEVETVRYQTPHDDPVFLRYFRGIGYIIERAPE